MDQLLNKLVNCFSVSGFEDDMRKIIIDEIQNIDGEIKEDKMGNLIVKLGEGKEKIMICAHMDNFGFIIKYIEDSGFARVGRIGDFEINNLVHNLIKFKNGTIGKIAAKKKNPKEEDLFIDLGVSSRKDALNLIKEGDVAVCIGDKFQQGNNIISPNLNNAIACYTLIRLIKEVNNFNRQTYFVFSSQEYLGGKGARAAAHIINPDYCIVLHHEESENIKLGKGPIITVMDRSLIIHSEVKEILEKNSEKADVNVQYFISKSSTEGGNIHKELGGIKTGVFSIPIRYACTPSEMVSLKDVEDRINVLKELL